LIVHNHSNQIPENIKTTFQIKHNTPHKYHHHLISLQNGFPDISYLSNISQKAKKLKGWEGEEREGRSSDVGIEIRNPSKKALSTSSDSLSIGKNISSSFTLFGDEPFP